MARITSSIVTPANQALQLPENQAPHHPFHKNPTLEADPRTPNSGRKPGNLLGIVFYFHLFAVTVLAVVLTIRGFLSHHARLHFQPLDWYPPILTSVGLAGIIGLSWQMLTHYNPRKAIKLAFWLSPLLTCAMGIVLISNDSGSGLGFGVMFILVAIVQSLYGCWVSPRFDHAVAVLTVSTTFPPPKTMVVSVIVVVATVVYCCVLMCGIGGATATGAHIDKVLIAVILISLAWTMQVIKNSIQVAVSCVKYLNFSTGEESDICKALRVAAVDSAGPVCLGSILVPAVSLVRGSARAVSLTAGDADEFLFSCADCYSSVASTLVTRGNRWGFVHVGAHGKGIVRASEDTWRMFQGSGMVGLIDSDLTSSLCFFSGVAGGALSSLAGGIWSVVNKGYATEITVYGFMVGYLLTRIAMAWPQACVSAYHVAFAENPQSARFDGTIPVRLQELQRYQV